MHNQQYPAGWLDLVDWLPLLTVQGCEWPVHYYDSPYSGMKPRDWPYHQDCPLCRGTLTKPATPSLDSLLCALWADGYYVQITHVSSSTNSTAGEWLVGRGIDDGVGQALIDPRDPLPSLIKATLQALKSKEVK